MSCRALAAAAALSLSSLATAPTFADVFRFKDGRVIAGKVANKSQVKVGEAMETLWAVEIEPGSFIKIYDSNLEPGGHKTLTPAEIEYAEKVKTLPETAEAHYQLAGWCTANGLKDLTQAHYLRVLDIDPNQVQARAAAGFRKDENGRWVKSAEIMQGQRGKVLYKGSWRFPESIAIEQAEEERHEKTVAASKDIYRWHNDAIKGNGNRQAQAFENLQQIRDPLSAGALAELLHGSSKPAIAATPPQMKLLYIRLLSQFRTFEAAQALAQASIRATEPQVRNTAIDSLELFGGEVAASIYIGYLKSQDNVAVNLAADGLGQLQAQEAVLPLINALVTKHPQKVGGGNTNYTPVAMTFGSKEETMMVPVQNQSVLGTLSQLTRQNFDYDRDQWLAWYASLHASPADDLRRDP